MLGPAATRDYRQITALDERWLGSVRAGSGAAGPVL